MGKKMGKRRNCIGEKLRKKEAEKEQEMEKEKLKRKRSFFSYLGCFICHCRSHFYLSKKEKSLNCQKEKERAGRSGGRRKEGRKKERREGGRKFFSRCSSGLDLKIQK